MIRSIIIVSDPNEVVCMCVWRPILRKTTEPIYSVKFLHRNGQYIGITHWNFYSLSRWCPL